LDYSIWIRQKVNDCWEI